jgi:hypothetical protein
MTRTQMPSEQITEEVTSWPRVKAGPGRRGEFAFKIDGREIGHLHGDHAAHFSFPQQIWLELREEGRIIDHPVFPGKVGPAARRIEDEADVRDVIELLRLNYDRLWLVGRCLPAKAGRRPIDERVHRSGAGLPRQRATLGPDCDGRRRWNPPCRSGRLVL